MQQHQRAGQNALSGPFLSSTPLRINLNLTKSSPSLSVELVVALSGPFLSSTPLRINLTKSSPSLSVELVVGFVPRTGRVLKYGYILVDWCRWGENRLIY